MDILMHFLYIIHVCELLGYFFSVILALVQVRYVRNVLNIKG